LEDKLWAEMKRLHIDAERQQEVKVKENTYFFDFAIYCDRGKIDVETDGDTWHINKEGALRDNLRDNDLETIGWKTLRFSTFKVREEMVEYCVPTITENINRLGGLKQEKMMPRPVNLDGNEQLTLF